MSATFAARGWLSVAGAAVLGLASAAALDAAGVGSFAGHRVLALAGVAALAGLAASAPSWPFAVDRRRAAARFVTGASVAAVLAFVLARAPFGWLDLGPLGGGAPGELPLLVLPLANVLALLAAWPAGSISSNPPRD